MNATGTTSNNVGLASVSFNIGTAVIPGIHSVYAKITAGGRTRFLYAPELLTVVSSFDPPRLEIVQQTTSQVRVDMVGVPGQRIALERTSDFQTWEPLGTNWLTIDRWSYLESVVAPGSRFYRAALK